MKIGELYRIEHKGGEEALENMYNDGHITFNQLQEMKVPRFGVLLGFEDNSLSQEQRTGLEARLEEMNAKVSYDPEKKRPETFYKTRELIKETLESKPIPRFYGIFMCDGEIQCKLKLSDVILTKV